MGNKVTGNMYKMYSVQCEVHVSETEYSTVRAVMSQSNTFAYIRTSSLIHGYVLVRGEVVLIKLILLCPIIFNKIYIYVVCGIIKIRNFIYIIRTLI